LFVDESTAVASSWQKIVIEEILNSFQYQTQKIEFSFKLAFKWKTSKKSKIEKMKLLIILSAFFAVLVKSSSALECMGCQISDLSVKCEYTYECKKGVETCQTVVSKVNGNYSIIMSCATKDSCGHDTVFNEGFEGCQHSK
jgi:hypothetical protein